jgi:arginine:pyruvate transaminase
VLTPTPTYATYEHTVALAGGELLLAPQPVEDDFKMSVSSLASALSSHQGQVAAVLITNPHNPTGHLLTRDELAPLGALCEQHDLYLVVDEVYGPLVYDTSPEARAFTSCAAVPGLSQRAIGLGSFSKVSRTRRLPRRRVLGCMTGPYPK